MAAFSHASIIGQISKEPSSSFDTGWVFPALAATSDDATSPWSDVANIYAADDEYASQAVGTPATENDYLNEAPQPRYDHLREARQLALVFLRLACQFYQQSICLLFQNALMLRHS